jgi:hypothetical protein
LAARDVGPALDQVLSSLQDAQQRMVTELDRIDAEELEGASNLLPLGLQLLELQKQAGSLTSDLIQQNALMSQIAAAAALEMFFRQAWERVAERTGVGPSASHNQGQRPH